MKLSLYEIVGLLALVERKKHRVLCTAVYLTDGQQVNCIKLTVSENSKYGLIGTAHMVDFLDNVSIISGHIEKDCYLIPYFFLVV